MVFELGKFYKHSGGGFMHMIAAAESPIMWMGPTLIAESPDGSLTPCGMDETSAQNWCEISKDEYMSNLEGNDMDKRKVNVWTCKIVITGADLPNGFDSPPRMAAQAAIEAAGFEVLMNASGWGGELTDSDKEYLKSGGLDAHTDVYFAGAMDAPEDTSH